MIKGSSYTITGLLYLAVAIGTASEAGFAMWTWAGGAFFALLGASFALSFFVWRAPETSRAMVLGYIGAQLLLFCLLHRLSVPNGLFWLLAMPVISHATYCLFWYGAALAVSAYMALFAWIISRQGGGGAALSHALLQYGIGCLFTVIFTHVTRQSVRAQEETARLAHELEEANARLRESAARDLEHAAMSERNRIARDIHDGLGHYLTTIAVQLEAARGLMKSDPEKAAATLGLAERQSREALEEVRRSVRALRSDAPSPDLRDTIAGLINESGLTADLHVHGEPRTLPAAVVQALFRTAQEGLTNVRKHAGTKTVRVEIGYLSGRATIEIADDGRGASGAPGGFGLAGLRERLESLGGRLQAGSRPEGGYRLWAEVPV